MTQAPQMNMKIVSKSPRGDNIVHLDFRDQEGAEEGKDEDNVVNNNILSDSQVERAEHEL